LPLSSIMYSGIDS